MDLIAQLSILVFGCSAVWFVGRREDWRRWGYILGLLGQPFWFYTTIRAQQWGITALCARYTYSWGQGVWNYWIKCEDAKHSLARVVSWRWWNERVVEVPDHFYDWMAPRWYLVIVVAAYALLLAGFVKALTVIAS